MYYDEVRKMIDNFNMEEFLQLDSVQKQLYGAWIIITDNQYVVGNNENDKLGYHADSIRKVLCEIFDVDRYHKIVTPTYSKNNFIIGTLISSFDMADILFSINDLDGITPNQLLLFEKFMDEYNDIVKNKSSELGRRLVSFSIDGVIYSTEDFSILHDVLLRKVDKYKEIPQDINIIGKGIEEEFIRNR